MVDQLNSENLINVIRPVLPLKADELELLRLCRASETKLVLNKEIKLLLELKPHLLLLFAE
jgi:hypothetical protein